MLGPHAHAEQAREQRAAAPARGDDADRQRHVAARRRRRRAPAPGRCSGSRPASSASPWSARGGAGAPRRGRRRRRAPSRSLAASRLAAATASWIARLMPTPPTGDIACAASPMQSSPGLRPARSRSTATVSSLTSSHERDVSATRVAEHRRGRRRPASRKTLDALARASASAPPLGMTKRALPVVAAVDRDEEVARRRSRARLLSSSVGSRPTRNQSTSIGAPTSSTASPAAARTVEWRPSQPIVQSARISNSPSGARPRTPTTRAVGLDQRRSPRPASAA